MKVLASVSLGSRKWQCGVFSLSSCCFLFKWSDKLAVQSHYRAPLRLFIFLWDSIFVIHTLFLSFLSVFPPSLSLSLFFNQQSNDCWLPERPPIAVIFYGMTSDTQTSWECVHLLSFQSRQLWSSCRRLKVPEGLAEGGAMLWTNGAWSIITDVTGTRAERSSCGGFMWAECVAGAVAWFWARVHRPSSWM